MTSSSFFEIVVVGTDLSGLVLAATAAKRGYRVLVVGQGQKPNSYDHMGFPFSRRPHLFHDLSASPAAEAVLVELGLNIELRNRLRAIVPRYQFVTPGNRVDFDTDPTVLTRELEREFPGQVRAIERYLRTIAEDNASLQAVLELAPPIPPDGFRERRQHRKAVSGVVHLIGRSTADGQDPLSALPAGHPARAMLAAPLPFLGNPDLRTTPYLPWVRSAVHAAQGFHLLEGGLDRLKGLFLEKVTAHCGSHRSDAVVEELRIVRGKVRSVLLRRNGEEVGCKLVVCNSDPKRFFGLVSHEHQKERFHHGLRSLQPSHYLATLNLAIAGEVVQEGMCPVVFHVPDPGAPLEDENLIVLTTDPRVHSTSASGASGAAGASGPAPYRVLTASCLIAARGFSPRVEFGRAVQARLLDRLARFVPFLGDRLLADHLTWLPADPEARDLDMSEVLPLYADARENTLEGSPLDLVSGYKNILVGSDAVLAGYGLEGTFLAGLTLVRHACRLVVLKSLLHD